MSALQCCELLAKSQVFQKQGSTRAEESRNRAKKKSHGIDHAGGGISFRLWTATSHPVEIKGGQNFGERQGRILHRFKVGFVSALAAFMVIAFASKRYDTWIHGDARTDLENSIDHGSLNTDLQRMLEITEPSYQAMVPSVEVPTTVAVAPIQVIAPQMELIVRPAAQVI